jgi:hypothetical protein
MHHKKTRIPFHRRNAYTLRVSQELTRAWHEMNSPQPIADQSAIRLARSQRVCADFATFYYSKFLGRWGQLRYWPGFSWRYKAGCILGYSHKSRNPMYSWLLIIEMLFWVPTTPGIMETTEFSKSMKAKVWKMNGWISHRKVERHKGISSFAHRSENRDVLLETLVPQRYLVACGQTGNNIITIF